MYISAVQGVRDEIALRLNEAESDNTDTYTNWINLCFKDVNNTFPNSPILWTSADRTLSAATRIYTLPTGFDKMDDVTLPSNNTKLSFLSPQEFDMLAPSATGGGNPLVYTIRNMGSPAPVIEYYWMPGSSITVHYNYWQQIDTVSAGSAAITQVPAKYFELPVLYGEKMGLRRRGRYADSQFVDREYQNLKQQMISDLQRQTGENVRIKSIREFQQGAQGGTNDVIRNIFNT